MTDSLDRWIRALAEALQLSPDDVDREGVLDLAGRAAHRVARPAAPMTTYLVGLAAAKAGGGADGFARAAAIADELSQDWQVPLETGCD